MRNAPRRSSTRRPPAALAAAALATIAALAAPPAGRSAQAPAADTAASGASAASGDRSADIVDLGLGTWWLPGRFERGRQPDGNSLLLQGDEGLLVIDTGRHVEHSDAIAAWVRGRGHALRTIINTHWHLDHVGGNARLRALAPALQSHGSRALRDAVEDRMPRSERELRDMAADPATPADLRRIVEIDLDLYARRAAFAPDRLVDGPARDVTLAGRALTLGVERGVSGGDVWVLDRASGVLALGDFVTLPVPFLDTACPPQWQAALGRLEALPFRSVLPGHGPLMSREDFARYRRAFDRLLACAASDDTVAACGTRWVEDLGTLLPAASARSVTPMLGHYFAQRLRAPAEAQRAFCGD